MMSSAELGGSGGRGCGSSSGNVDTTNGRSGCGGDELMVASGGDVIGSGGGSSISLVLNKANNTVPHNTWQKINCEDGVYSISEIQRILEIKQSCILPHLPIDEPQEITKFLTLMVKHLTQCCASSPLCHVGIPDYWKAAATMMFFFL